MTKSIYLISSLLLLCLYACEKEEQLLVYTDTIAAITDSSVWVNASVIGSVVEKGIVYGTSGEPTLEEHTGIEFNYDEYDHFGVKIEGLQSGTLYYLRAFAKDDKGVGYGETKPFYTYPENCDTASFPSVTIGGLCWSRENVSGNKYINGDWIDTNCIGGHLIACVDGEYFDYSYYYNHRAATDSRKICPEGWHVPTKSEWNQLILALGGTEIAGRKMKTYGIEHWDNIEEAGINESGFKLLPTGHATQGQPNYADIYTGQCQSASFIIADDPLLVLEISNYSSAANYISSSSAMYHSCRCVKD